MVSFKKSMDAENVSRMIATCVLHTGDWPDCNGPGQIILPAPLDGIDHSNLVYVQEWSQDDLMIHCALNGLSLIVVTNMNSRKELNFQSELIKMEAHPESSRVHLNQLFKKKN